jgi:hypothetical protein
MTLSIKIIDTEKEIAKNINIGISEYINNKITQQLSFMTKEIIGVIPSWVSVQPEILSLLSQDEMSLAGQFGIAGGTDGIVNSIVSSIANSISIKFVKFNNNLKGGLEFYIQPDNFSNLLGLPQGHVIYSGGDLHWLDWLLIRGDQIIISNYQYNPSTGLGRSGLGNMIGGNSFRVPPAFAGTKNNNFVTRALSGPDQEKYFANLFQKALGK